MYGKIFEEIFDSTIMQHGGDTVYVFIAMIVLSDYQGYLRVAPAALARRIDKPIDIVQTAIKILEQPDHHSNTPTHEGRRIIPLSEITNGEENRGWLIVNKEKFRELQDHDTVRVQTRERVKRHRENKKNDVTVSNALKRNVTDSNGSKRHTDTNTNINKKGSMRGNKNQKSPSELASDFLEQVKMNPAYKHIDLDFESAKMDLWLTTRPGRKKTKRFVMNWLNKIEPPLPSAPPQNCGGGWSGLPDLNAEMAAERAKGVAHG